MQSWESWGSEEKASNNIQKTQQHSSKSNKLRPTVFSKAREVETEPEPDYFADMQPDVRKNAKVIIKKNTSNIKRASFKKNHLLI